MFFGCPLPFGAVVHNITAAVVLRSGGHVRLLCTVNVYSLSPLLSPPFGDRLVTGGTSSLAERVAGRSRLPFNRVNERL